MRRASLLLLACVAACSDDAATTTAAAPSDAGADAAEADAASASDGASPADAGPATSRCTITADEATCEHATLTVAGRTVAYAVPTGAAPAGGFPAVVFFQGSFVPGDGSFEAHATDAFGRYALTRTIAALLDRGYLVVAPDATANGTTFWQTNILPFAQSWPGCDDDVLVRALLDALGSGTFGATDAAHLYAMGISSGGFMTSRMAISYAGKFRALADHSGSYATCGPTCIVPTPLPADHPPTLFLHGDTDTVVPMSSVTPYVDTLTAEGHEVKVVRGAGEGHQWLEEAVDAVPAWFDAHR